MLAVGTQGEGGGAAENGVRVEQTRPPKNRGVGPRPTEEVEGDLSQTEGLIRVTREGGHRSLGWHTADARPNPQALSPGFDGLTSI